MPATHRATQQEDPQGRNHGGGVRDASFPHDAAVRKEFLPVIDRKGRMLPLILANVEEAPRSGHRGDLHHHPGTGQGGLRGLLFTEHAPRYSKSFSPCAGKPFGNQGPGQEDRSPCPDGAAGTRARGLPGPRLGRRRAIPSRSRGSPVRHPGSTGCARQLVDRYQEMDTALIGLQPTPDSDIGRFGTAGGTWVKGEVEENLLEISIFKEKPDIAFASEYLAVEGLPDRTYLTIFGLYLLPPAVFVELEKEVSACAGDQREVQLTDALEELRRKERVLGMVVDGEKVDIGLPEGYSQACSSSRVAHDHRQTKKRRAAIQPEMVRPGLFSLGCAVPRGVLPVPWHAPALFLLCPGVHHPAHRSHPGPGCHIRRHAQEREGGDPPRRG